MTETITTYTGLLSQKSGSPKPRKGEQRFLSWQSKTGKSGKDYIKIKNETAEYGGKLCEILNVKQTDFTDPHGNISFDVEFTPLNNGVGVRPGKVEATGTNNQPHHAAPDLDARQRAIIRQHSQSMALSLLELKVKLGELTVEDLTPAKLRALADYFDNDVLGQ